MAIFEVQQIDQLITMLMMTLLSFPLQMLSLLLRRLPILLEKCPQVSSTSICYFLFPSILYSPCICLIVGTATSEKAKSVERVQDSRSCCDYVLTSPLAIAQLSRTLLTQDAGISGRNVTVGVKLGGACLCD